MRTPFHIPDSRKADRDKNFQLSRLALLVMISAAWAMAQAPLTKTLSAEMERNFNVFKAQGGTPAYFMAYEVTDTEADVIVATSGSVNTQNHNRVRQLDVTIRMGNPAFDNYRKLGNGWPQFTAGTVIALDDNPQAIRTQAWLATDKVYRNASRESCGCRPTKNCGRKRQPQQTLPLLKNR